MCRTTAGPQRWTSVLVLCSSSQSTSAPSLVGWSCPWHPGWRGSVFGTMQTLWCARGGVGATQLSSSLQRQEEDGHGPPELRVGLAGHSTARHHHHCDRKERRKTGRGSSQFGRTREEQAGRPWGARYFAPSLWRPVGRHRPQRTQTHLSARTRGDVVEGLTQPAGVQVLALWLTKTRSNLLGLKGPQFPHL